MDKENKTKDEEIFTEEIRQRFDDIAKEYNERHYLRPLTAGDLYPNLLMRKKYILDLITQKGNCLDAGCGSGNLLLEFVRRGNKVWGIDLSEKMVSEAKNLLKTTDVDWSKTVIEVGDFQGKDYPKDFFDVIIASGFIEYCYNPEAALAKLSSLLKKGGELIISAPNNLCVYRFLEKFVNLARIIKYRDVNINKRKKRGNYAYKKFSPGQLDKLCKKYGLEKKDFRYLHFLVVPPIFDRIDPKGVVRFNMKFEKFCKNKFSKFFAGGYLVRVVKK